MQDVETIRRALRCAIQQAADHEKTMRAVAKALRGGEQVAMFAPGEAGARAAEALADDHAAFVKNCRVELAVLDGCEPDEDDEDDE